MKKLVALLFLLVVITSVAIAQERTKMVLDLKNGTSVTGYVMEQEDGSYMVETESGDILFFRHDEVSGVRKPGEEKGNVVQRLKSAAEKATGTTASGYQGHLLERSGFSLTFKDTGIDLQPDQVSDSFWTDYNGASRRKKAGMKMMIIGGASALAGYVGYLSFGESYYYSTSQYRDYNGKLVSYDNSYYDINAGGYICLGVITAGAILVTSGAINFFIGNAKLGRLAKQFNNGNGYASELSFEYTPTGLALVYSF